MRLEGKSDDTSSLGGQGKGIHRDIFGNGRTRRAVKFTRITITLGENYHGLQGQKSQKVRFHLKLRTRQLGHNLEVYKGCSTVKNYNRCFHERFKKILNNQYSFLRCQSSTILNKDPFPTASNKSVNWLLKKSVRNKTVSASRRRLEAILVQIRKIWLWNCRGGKNMKLSICGFIENCMYKEGW